MARHAYPRLTADIVAFAKAASPSEDERSRRQTALETITAAVKKEWPDAEVSVFGSAACGTTLPSSDIDVAVNGPHWNADASVSLDAANLAARDTG